MTDDNKISKLYQQGKEQGPPAHLDNAILNMAKDAVQADNSTSKVKGPFSGGWPMTASIAAVLVITVILVPLLQQEEFSPSEKNIMSRPESLMMEQDAVKQGAYTERGNSERMETIIKSKKRKLVIENRQKAEREMVVSPLREENFSNMDQMSSQEESPMLMSAPALSNESVPLVQSGASAIMASDLSEAALKPADWLEEIKKLINQNELDQAREELIEFRKHYPDEEVDASILSRL